MLRQGMAEKQVAFHLGLSRHTVHNYVKALHRHFNVNGRVELLARSDRPAPQPGPTLASVSLSSGSSVPFTP